MHAIFIQTDKEEQYKIIVGDFGIDDVLDQLNITRDTIRFISEAEFDESADMFELALMDGDLQIGHVFFKKELLQQFIEPEPFHH